MQTPDAPSTTVTIDTVTWPDPDVYTALARLLPQLSTSAPPLTREQFDDLIACPATELLIARTGDGVIAGALTLVVHPLATGVRARIEDVVVDHRARGQGIAKRLTATAVTIAKTHHARTVDLTSGPSRAEAHQLYLSMGFQPRDSTTYRLAP
ncbi:GNAT family N-acetyltransferase [Nocardia sp. alder85J]|uniref:GNAT family N-acetyltransferase n=1 Tax=Nocardia sp. alder85J TaxID=2862949 RepID=UPI001CD2B9D7|nr:GNAT family N-acetyltransferase [Nocardia sp. alder85J]MCX4097933.1 GNAT family N-acetyltransferase [Nocardia sp. alder85J]